MFLNASLTLARPITLPHPHSLATGFRRTVDESPRWLIVRGRHDEATMTLKKAAKWNKTTLPPVDELWTLMRRIRGQVRELWRPVKGGRNDIVE